MEENCKKIVNQISKDLDKINEETFLISIQNVKEENEYFEISREFCKTIIDTKKTILLNISEELESLMRTKTEINSNIKMINNDLNQLINNVRSIINQSKFKLKGLTSNINDLNSNLNLITGNLEKKKYSLAISRIEKLFQLKNTMSINIKSLESFHQKILEELKSEQIANKKAFNSKFSNNRFNRTPSPLNSQNKLFLNKSIRINKIEVQRNKSRHKRDLSLSTYNAKNRRVSINTKDNSLNTENRNFSRNKNDLNYVK